MWGRAYYPGSSAVIHTTRHCRVWGKDQPHELRGIFLVFSLVGLNFFPYSKKIQSTCSGCRRTRIMPLRDNQNVLDAQSLSDLHGSPSQLRFYTGFLVLLILLIIPIVFFLVI
jgi:hypothetical protein